MGVLGGASVLSRIGFGSLVRRYGSFRLFRGCYVIHSASFVIWLVAGGSYAVLLLFVLVLGVGYGGFVALGPIVISDRMGVVGLGSILGLLYTAPGLGGLIGPPVPPEPKKRERRLPTAVKGRVFLISDFRPRSGDDISPIGHFRRRQEKRIRASTPSGPHIA